MFSHLILTFWPLSRHPVLALILVFHTSDVYEKEKTIEESAREDQKGRGEAEDVTWFKQTINKTCGFYGILCMLLAPDSIMARVQFSCEPLGPGDRANVIECLEEIKSAYPTVALQGDSDVPENAEDEVDFHYMCFVKSSKTRHSYELDGVRKGPVDHGILEAGEDILSGRALSIIQNLISREKGQNVNFGLSALVLAGAEASKSID